MPPMTPEEAKKAQAYYEAEMKRRWDCWWALYPGLQEDVMKF